MINDPFFSPHTYLAGVVELKKSINQSSWPALHSAESTGLELPLRGFSGVIFDFLNFLFVDCCLYDSVEEERSIYGFGVRIFLFLFVGVVWKL